jgi:hypothetical protein
MKKMMYLIFAMMSIGFSNAHANLSASYDIYYPISKAISPTNADFESDLRIEKEINQNISFGMEFYYNNSVDIGGSEASSSSGYLPSLNRIIEGQTLVVAKYALSGFSYDTFYTGFGAGIAKRTYLIEENNVEVEYKKVKPTFNISVGYQWQFSERFYLAIEFQKIFNLFDKSISKVTSNYTYSYTVDDSGQLNPKIFLTYSF